MTAWMTLALLCALAGPALADPTADARAHSEAFARAWNAGDVQGALALYVDDAVVVWPGRKEEARGRAGIEKLLTDVFQGTKERKLVLESIEARALGDAHIATVGHWDSSFTGPDGRRVTERVRTTEVLVRSGEAWRYLIDHASVGQPPPAPPAAPTRRQRRAR